MEGYHSDRWLLPNGVRLSCAAMVCFSQMQFYYDGRRQLQPLVRQQPTRRIGIRQVPTFTDSDHRSYLVMRMPTASPTESIRCRASVR